MIESCFSVKSVLEESTLGRKIQLDGLVDISCNFQCELGFQGQKLNKNLFEVNTSNDLTGCFASRVVYGSRIEVFFGLLLIAVVMIS